MRLLATGLLTSYFAVQLFASFPREFLDGAPARAHHVTFDLFTQMGLSPGIPVFSGNLPQRVPHLLCLVGFGHTETTTEVIYESDSCRRPTVRIVENSFDAHFAYSSVLSKITPDKTPPFEQRYAKLLCESRFFGGRRFDSVALALHVVSRDYKTNELFVSVDWPIFQSCRGATRNTPSLVAFERALKAHLISRNLPGG